MGLTSAGCRRCQLTFVLCFQSILCRSVKSELPGAGGGSRPGPAGLAASGHPWHGHGTALRARPGPCPVPSPVTQRGVTAVMSRGRYLTTTALFCTTYVFQ